MPLVGEPPTAVPPQEKSLLYTTMPTYSTSDPILNKILNAIPERWEFIFENPDRYNLQFIYTAIDRDSKNRPSFFHHPFNLNKTRYFYPASLVKLPAAALALEKINSLSIKGLTAASPMQVVNTLPCAIPYDHEEGCREEDPVSVESSIRRMLLASDNGAYNRIWEFLTRDYANKRLTSSGFGNIRLLHRLASGCTPEENRVSNPVRFFDGSGTIIYEQDRTVSSVPDVNPLAPVFFGRASVVNGELVPAPFSADYCNCAPLDDLHRFLIEVMFPESHSPGMSIDLRGEDYRLLRTWMGLFPRELDIVRFAGLPDDFKKFFLPGSADRPGSPMLREYNVIGRAYGFLSDLAYLADHEKGIEFFLSATIYVNENGIVNDDVYEYDTIGRPFLADLCTAVYSYELSREREFKPDLREFLPRIKY